MSVTLKNIYSLVNRDTGNENTNQTKSFGSEGISRFVYNGAEYVCGVNATVGVPDLIGDAWVAADSKMKVINRT